MIEIEMTDSEILQDHKEVEDKICPHPPAQEAAVAVAEVVAAAVVVAEVAVAAEVTINLGTPMVSVRNS